MKILNVVRVASLTFGLFSSVVLADDYPNKPVKMIAPYPPGGTTDILARAISQELTKSLGQPVIVDNRVGAGGMIGHDVAAKSPADGYTLVLGNSAMLAVSVGLYPNLPYDPIKDFAPITEVAAGALVLVVNPSLKVVSVQELIKLAKSKPGKLNAALSATGSMHHLVTDMIKLRAEVDWTNIPYKGSAPMLVGLLGDQVDFGFDNIPSALPYIKSNRLRAIAVSGPTRTELLPDVPTVKETGIEGVTALAWHGVLAPAGTPEPIINRLNAEIVKILMKPEMKARLSGLGLEPIGNSPGEFHQFIRDENTKWRKIVEETGAKAE